MRDEVIARLVSEVVDLRGRLASLETQERGRSPVLIRQEILTSDAASVTFSDIPQTFRGLELRIYARSSKVARYDNVLMRCNADSGASYNNAQFGSWGTGVYAWEGIGVTSMSIGWVSAASAAANQFGVIVASLPGYRGAGKKSLVASNHSGDETTSSLSTGASGGNWESTDAVTSLTLFAEGGDLLAGTEISLHGVP